MRTVSKKGCICRKIILLPAQDALKGKHIAALADECTNSIGMDILIVSMCLFYDFVKATSKEVV